MNRPLIHVINGPNLDILGERESDIYGSLSLADLEGMISAEAADLGMDIKFFQSNYEGAVIDEIHSASSCQGVIINPAAFTHYSYAIRDALAALKCPVVEVHISNIYKREEFRAKSVTAPAVTGQISGLGHYGYIAALRCLSDMIQGGLKSENKER